MRISAGAGAATMALLLGAVGCAAQSRGPSSLTAPSSVVAHTAGVVTVVAEYQTEARSGVVVGYDRRSDRYLIVTSDDVKAPSAIRLGDGTRQYPVTVCRSHPGALVLLAVDASELPHPLTLVGLVKPTVPEAAWLYLPDRGLTAVRISNQMAPTASDRAALGPEDLAFTPPNAGPQPPSDGWGPSDFGGAPLLTAQGVVAFAVDVVDADKTAWGAAASSADARRVVDEASC